MSYCQTGRAAALIHGLVRGGTVCAFLQHDMTVQMHSHMALYTIIDVQIENTGAAKLKFHALRQLKGQKSNWEIKGKSQET